MQREKLNFFKSKKKEVKTGKRLNSYLGTMFYKHLQQYASIHYIFSSTKDNYF